MRILFIAPHPFYQDRGTPIAVDMLLRALSERGDVVDLITYREGEDRSYPGLSIIRTKGFGGVGPGFSLTKLANDFLMFLALIRRSSRQRYDIVHAVEESAFMARILGIFTDTPYVFDMDSVLSQQLVEKHPVLSHVSGLLEFMEGWAVRGASAVVPMCDAVADRARDYGATNVRVLKDVSLVAAQGEQPCQLDLRNGLPDDAVLCLYIGNLEPYQGIDLLLEALAVSRRQNSGIFLRIVGGRSDHIDLFRGKIQTLNLEDCCEFVGPQPVAMIGSLMRQADILVSPRVSGNNTPMKIYSYLDSGVAVLATDLPTHTQVMDSTIGYLSAADADSFSKALLELAGNPELRGSLSRQARIYIRENHSYETFRQTVNELYDGLKGAKVVG